MRRIALAIVVAALIVGDIIEDMGLMQSESRWAVWSSAGIVVFLLDYYYGRNRD